MFTTAAKRCCLELSFQWPENVFCSFDILMLPVFGFDTISILCFNLVCCIAMHGGLFLELIFLKRGCKFF